MFKRGQASIENPVHGIKKCIVKIELDEIEGR